MTLGGGEEGVAPPAAYLPAGPSRLLGANGGENEPHRRSELLPCQVDLSGQWVNQQSASCVAKPLARRRRREREEGEGEKGRGGKGSFRSLIMCSEKKLDSRGNVTMVVLKTNR